MAEGGVEITTRLHPEAFVPVLLGLVLATLIWHFWTPRALRRMLIAFHVGGDDYEVHQITESTKDARELLGIKGAGFGIMMYILAITGILILAMEIMLTPVSFNLYALGVIAALLGIPILVSPIISLTSQLRSGATSKKTSQQTSRLKSTLITFSAIGVILLVIAAFINISKEKWSLSADEIFAWTILILLLPAIIAYGRIMGSSWSSLVHSKYHRAAGRASNTHPKPPSFVGRMVAIFVLFNAVVMPLTALNGVASFAVQFENDWGNGNIASYFVHSESVKELEEYEDIEDDDPYWTNPSTTLTQDKGILGFFVVETSVIIDDYQWRTGVVAMVILFLLLNVTVMGIAFVYEVARLQFLGVASIGGRGGITLAEPRVLRSEKSQQARILSFCFSGFAGYTVFLLVVALFSRDVFNQFMLNPSNCTSWLGNTRFWNTQDAVCPMFQQNVLDRLTWTLGVAGQTIFLLVWLISLPSIPRLRRAKFDLNAAETRNASINVPFHRLGSSKKLTEMIGGDDLGNVRLKLEEMKETRDPSERAERTQGEMMLAAYQGMWNIAEERATSLLAQHEGEDDLARKILAASALASRDLEEAKLGMVELNERDLDNQALLWAISLIDPNNNDFSTDYLPSLEMTPTGRRFKDLVSRYAIWRPWPEDVIEKGGGFDRRSLLSDIALLRLFGHHDVALEFLTAVMPDGGETEWPRGKVTQALLLLDIGEVTGALAIHEQLLEANGEHPAVAGLSEVLRSEGIIPPSMNRKRNEWLPEVMLAAKDPSYLEWGELVEQVPTNPVAALRLGRGGIDEVLSSNAWLVSGVAAKKGIHPSRPNPFSKQRGLLILSLLIPLIFIKSNPVLAGIILVVGLTFRTFRIGKNTAPRHRNMPAMKRLARRLKRKKAIPKWEELPLGIHLLLSGLMVDIEGVPVDLGFPAWLDPYSAVKRKLLPSVQLPNLSHKKRREVYRRMVDFPPAIARRLAPTRDRRTVKASNGIPTTPPIPNRQFSPRTPAISNMPTSNSKVSERIEWLARNPDPQHMRVNASVRRGGALPNPLPPPPHKRY